MKESIEKAKLRLEAEYLQAQKNLARIINAMTENEIGILLTEPDADHDSCPEIRDARIFFTKRENIKILYKALEEKL